MTWWVSKWGRRTVLFCYAATEILCYVALCSECWRQRATSFLQPMIYNNCFTQFYLLFYTPGTYILVCSADHGLVYALLYWLIDWVSELTAESLTGPHVYRVVFFLEFFFKFQFSFVYLGTIYIINKLWDALSDSTVSAWNARSCVYRYSIISVWTPPSLRSFSHLAIIILRWLARPSH